MGTFKVGDRVQIKGEYAKYAKDNRLEGILTISEIGTSEALNNLVSFEGRGNLCFDYRLERVSPWVVSKSEVPSVGLNPKDLIGSKKPDYQYVPMAPMYDVGQAMKDGADKYGPFNWRQQPVTASVYINACRRHLDLWEAGEENARDSGVHHLAHAAAGMFILMDAQAHDSLHDDRVNDATLIERLAA